MTTFHFRFSLALIGLSFLLTACASFWRDQEPAQPVATEQKVQWSAEVNHPLFTLTPGTKKIYEAKTEDGIERIEVAVTSEKKMVLGIPMTVVWDRVWLDGVLIEDTKDWYAQDTEGTVWYFGEAVDNYKNGQLVDHKGSWEAGVDGAKQGIVMKAKVMTGDKYQQEYYAGKAEDRAEVNSITAAVTVPIGLYTDCIRTLDTTPLEPDVREEKYYCAEVGGLVLEVDLESGERAELVKVE